MIKKCLVTLNNELVTVVKFGDKHIQFPSIKREATTVNVRCEDGKYFIVENDEKIQSEPKPKKKVASKKTTIEIETDSEQEIIPETEDENK